ncbi:phage assembly protein [Myxococcus stipitatus DSM 14675]|uniref:Phage assembly protein n=1 Tax=Myxococcus stipitatus (strain DSM 14675 / JCM 12634 / Mx s8) TaxID=1278073 RepID=L7U388_MYXSD|nr:phage baseplate assembly protein V [Myxococcus stipitatus]AGC43251.1 phage assembly protein [Myxococcus stipitatus DSM 14675]
MSNPLTALRNLIANVVARGFLRRANDTGRLQTLQVDVGAGETREVERFQNYGFTSVPPAGAEAAVVFVGGRRDHGIAVAVDDRRCRLAGLEQGEVAVYTDQGDKVVIKRGGVIEISATTKVVINAPLVELTGATNPVAKGDALNKAVKDLGTAVAAALTAASAGGASLPVLGAAMTTAGTAVTNAVNAFNTAAEAALSTKVKVS